ncbi:LOW QUALITY PROTEIN: eukaryotic translation initiation factor 3 subunit M-like, partial [Dendronephthya gigantea]|uniref:LOW QUALITY PROTEIN: eukaryotic translation initiation factor 3 subunit M-like n=1 Tax=Dendronephthya gigantea TaxID=151771 RepID=UPI00106B1279
GATIEDDGPEDLSENLSEIFSVCIDVIKTCSEAEIEGFLNSLLSLIFALTEKRDEVICAFLECLVEMTYHAELRHRLMNLLFCGLNKMDPIRYNVYCHQLELSANSGVLELVNTDIDQVKIWLAQWSDVEKSRKIYRLLHDSFVANKQRDNAALVMIELLKTYPEDSNVEAKDDAIKCIVSFIDRPNVWIMDHLLELGPVKSLKGELIYQILEIFVSGNIQDYMKFYEDNSNFLMSTGLNHERNLRKCEFSLSKKLDINVDDVESFVINVLKTRLAHVRIDQIEKQIITSSAAHRTFQRNQWRILRQKLKEWQTNLQSVEKQLLDI